MTEISVDKKKKSFSILKEDHTLIVRYWGDNTVRVTVTPRHKNKKNLDSPTGIMELEKNIQKTNPEVVRDAQKIWLRTGDLKVKYNGEHLEFYNRNKLILSEYSRIQSDVRRTIGIDEEVPYPEDDSYSLNYCPYSFKKNSLGNYSTELLLEGDETEVITGLGGYQESNLNKNLNYYELMHRNSQTSIPIYLSSKNYGFIWNSSAVGDVFLGKNIKKWTASEDYKIDYLVTVGNGPKQILRQFSNMLGTAPMIDTNLLGLWQSKLRYQTLEELKQVAEGYKKREVPLSVLVIDYFHWPAQGDFKFDFNYWNGIKKFADQLKEQGTQLMVSLWPTVEAESENYDLYRKEKMVLTSKDGKNNVVFNGAEILDFSNPSTQKFIKGLLRRNYLDNGISLFWADQAEPEMNIYDHSRYQSYEGDFHIYASKYPYYYVKTVHGALPNDKSPTLIRSAWFNSQKYGALAWSGDIDSSFDSLRRQIQVGLNMGISGIPWWTSDIGGFHSGDSNSEYFKELLIRWFQFATFSPILRMHGDRQPHTPKIGETGGGVRTSGGPNEIWSFGSSVEETLKKYINIRHKIKPYLMHVYEEASKYGYPIMRPLFLEHPEDSKAWNDSYQYLLGSDLLVVPVTEYKATQLEVYLPEGNEWISLIDNTTYEGGTIIHQQVTLEEIPIYYKKNSQFGEIFEQIYGK
ncbi:glycosyl hydrolase family 31 [Dolosicoccus paucivorans]|uniref:Glycosyl hydrolase family 31 n=1 Tax=Dolosicoccus paucivorans TaxID=84521 RepID=A0A2N6SPG2_9LACT|nr:TIM-barrel domain-containing protein [Dolosicoccus paucivorans]PMC58965.1 glycosyl hydrolase family 31 [Dolosicoccus paucivorans]